MLPFPLLMRPLVRGTKPEEGGWGLVCVCCFFFFFGVFWFGGLFFVLVGCVGGCFLRLMLRLSLNQKMAAHRFMRPLALGTPLLWTRISEDLFLLIV